MVSKLKYGNTNTFFIHGISGNLLINTDYAGTLPAFYRAIKVHNIKISDITYVLATHYHPDHKRQDNLSAPNHQQNKNHHPK